MRTLRHRGAEQCAGGPQGLGLVVLAFQPRAHTGHYFVRLLLLGGGGHRDLWTLCLLHPFPKWIWGRPRGSPCFFDKEEAQLEARKGEVRGFAAKRTDSRRGRLGGKWETAGLTSRWAHRWAPEEQGSPSRGQGEGEPCMGARGANHVATAGKAGQSTNRESPKTATNPKPIHWRIMKRKWTAVKPGV